MLEQEQNFWTFVRDNISADPSALRLKYYGRADEAFDVPLAITQIECRKKFGKKLAQTLASDPEFLFLSVLAGEQSTSDALAQYHATLLAGAQSVVDLTSGLGIDVMHFAAEAPRVTAVEIDADKCEALRYNCSKMPGCGHVDVVNADCREFVSTCTERFDVAFIDPARRAADGARIFALADCQPDVVAMLDDLRRIAKRLIIKASPMLDITQVSRELSDAGRIIILGTPTECKELVAMIDFEHQPAELQIDAVTLVGDTIARVSFTPQQEREAAKDVRFGSPTEGAFLYEPFPAVMKAAPHNLLAQRNGLAKLHANTNLFVSKERNDDFPGDVMLIERVVPYESKYIKRLKSQYPQINVAARNFDISAEALRKKLGVKDGGDKRLFAVTLYDGRKVMIITDFPTR